MSETIAPLFVKFIPVEYILKLHNKLYHLPWKNNFYLLHVDTNKKNSMVSRYPVASAPSTPVDSS